MGEAKRRGTYEERKANAIAKHQSENNVIEKDQSSLVTPSLLMKMAMNNNGPNIHKSSLHKQTQNKIVK